jgi:UDP-N-acetylmuramoyl-L-alanyl-D-glutamate--2,6-diaminopimelate ligase
VSAARAQQVLDELAQRGVAAAALCGDSRTLRPGEVFVAYPGARSDGRRYIAHVAQRGAAAVLWEREGWTWDPSIDLPNVPVAALQGLSGWLGHLACGRPSERLWLVGVTGTNGKTSVSQWVAQCLQGLGRRCAVIGTLGDGFPGALAASPNTTPDALTLHRRLADFLERGAGAVAMEVSSIGLDQGRVDGAAFDVAVFTNLTRDHLEYHGTMAAYGEAKARLFALPGLAHAVLNLDDPFGRELARRLRGSGVTVHGYTLCEATPEVACDRLIAARDLRATAAGLRFEVRAPEGRVVVEARLVGRFNAANLLAVFATLLAGGCALEAAAAQLAQLAPPPGRMQMLGGEAAPLVVVDYAHTPDALEQALCALRETALARGGALACVFGCGGERDPGKRPVMGEVAARLADRVILTSDNPRSEDPQAIIASIARGGDGRAALLPDRAEAIRAAVCAAQARDVILVAGKGHETYQEVAGERLPFSDVEQAARALRLFGSRHP